MSIQKRAWIGQILHKLKNLNRGISAFQSSRMHGFGYMVLSEKYVSALQARNLYRRYLAADSPTRLPGGLGE